MMLNRTVSCGTISEFMSRGKKEDEILSKIRAHFDRHHIAYKVAGSFIIISLAGGVDFASTASAATNIDAAGRSIYFKIVDIGKWFIISKGGFDTIKSMMQGDADSAKRNFFSYLIVYVVLLGLPWGFDTVEDVFKDMTEG